MTHVVCYSKHKKRNISQSGCPGRKIRRATPDKIAIRIVHWQCWHKIAMSKQVRCHIFHGRDFTLKQTNKWHPFRSLQFVCVNYFINGCVWYSEADTQFHVHNHMHKVLGKKYVSILGNEYSKKHRRLE